MSADATTAARGRNSRGFALAQRFGRSLMLPIAVLPAAALLSRLGYIDGSGAGQGELIAAIPGDFFDRAAQVVGQGGDALFQYLPLLFAVGVAIGMARKADGSTALSAVVGYLVLHNVLWAMLGEELTEGRNFNNGPYGVLGGIVAGLIAAYLWQRYHRIKLPTYLGFFGGRRFVPMITALVMIVVGIVMALIFTGFNAGLTWVGDAVASSTVIGAGVYGTLNRFLLPFGLHHILNSVVWFLFGDYDGVTGDLNRFFAGDPAAGTFMSGFFPIFMFALPAAALAIYHTARPEKKKLVGGLVFAGALASFLTGVTEPLEYAFIFVAWPLLVVHAVLTGLSLAVTNALGVHHGFGFSAGAIDYVLNWGLATAPWLIIPIGLVFAAIYYFVFRWVITKWNLATPGREDDEDDQDGGAARPTPAEASATAGTATEGGASGSSSERKPLAETKE
ncbi:PTS system N-acetylglucosamine-specific IIC component [Actinoalloteichus hoggarensis]|uniref:PTS system glucose-specific EIICBA component n=1 Tax=Actinoalloteichus hoggarensis TaxID=1470176 RepID=A0A221W2B2_9PSEU|nr:PTS transporter subunit EIIC [Actinoalloteichus hoggarensis]ASO19922.1 PTS system glucose-specific EIICBA component [Actinoalloteichus hoggarensis]MBB5919368.1 PTS system N-acetylglucosamine-specific IIC component [Actinoalloteichus hoggarensis]